MIVGVSPAIRRAVALAERYASTPLPVLLVGATGTGKELFAQYLHERSGKSGPLVDVNCGALPREMVESLLFGHRRGAFTGAVESTEGYVARGHGGTLFLDELTSLTHDAQVKLLRVLETNEVEALGASRKRRIDLRIVAAAQDDLPAALSDGRLRRDLYQRLAGVVIELPLLAHRSDDLMPLAEHFASLNHRTLEPGVDAVLHAYAWPGNVRELRFAIERAGYLVENGSLSAAAVAQAIALGREATSEQRSFEDIITAGVTTGWNAARMATELGFHRSTLFRRLRQQGLTLRSLRESHQSRDGRATGATSGAWAAP